MLERFNQQARLCLVRGQVKERGDATNDPAIKVEFLTADTDAFYADLKRHKATLDESLEELRRLNKPKRG
jgi:hypothetical protein